MEAHADPVLDEQEDGAVDGVERHPYHEGPAIPRDRALPQESEDRDDAQSHQAGLDPGAAGFFPQLLNELRDAEPEYEPPALSGERDARIDQGQSGDPVEPLGTTPALALEGLALIVGRGRARDALRRRRRRCEIRRGSSRSVAGHSLATTERWRCPGLRRTTERTLAGAALVGLDLHMPSLSPRCQFVRLASLPSTTWRSERH